jgi:hypothetical protein
MWRVSQNTLTRSSLQREAECRKCDYPDGACYREGSCRRYFRLETPSPKQLHVPVFADLGPVGDFDPNESLNAPAEASVRTVTMARPNMPAPRRTDRRTADHWIRLAGQEAINHAGVCKPSGCVCPNCREYQEVRRRALEMYDKGYVTELSEAWHMAMDEITGGAANTVWARPSKAPEPRLPLPANAFEDYKKPVVASTPSVAEGSWVQKRFGVLDV